jgi:hypothetical protein
MASVGYCNDKGNRRSFDFALCASLRMTVLG